MNYRVTHITEVRYDALVNLARFNLRLRPAEWPGQVLTGYRLDVSPAPKAIIDEAGPFVVNSARLTLDKPTASLTVTSEFFVTVDRALAAARRGGADLGPGARGSTGRSRPFRARSGELSVRLADWRNDARTSPHGLRRIWLRRPA